MTARQITQLAISLLAIAAITTTLLAAPADVLESPGAIAEGNAPDALEIGAGDGAVSGKTGAYQHSIPIVVPPGRLDAQPSLSLSYSSQQPLYGGIAAGWSMSIPTISRDWSRGQFAAPVWTSSLAGRELVQVDTFEQAPGGWVSYRAQSDTSWARYQYYDDRWRVLMADGSVFHFGEPAYMAGGQGFSDWMPLTRSVDPFGNEVRYHWIQVIHGGELVGFRIDLIEYSINDGAGHSSPHARVQFVWAPPDLCGSESFPVGAQESFRSGSRRITGYSRLETVTTQVTDGAGAFRDVREYSFSYDQTALSCAASDRANDGPLRLLTSVDERAQSRDQVWTSQPTIQFSYGAAITATTTASINNLPSGIYPLPHGEGGHSSSLTPLGHAPESLLVDIDGDGRKDLLYSVPSPSPSTDPFCYLGWRRNLGRNGSGDVDFGTEATIQMPILPWANKIYNQSGSAVQNFGTRGSGESCTLAGQHTLESDPWEEDNQYGTNPPGTYIGAILIYSFRDVNGDGLTDLVTALEHDPSFFSAEPGNFLVCSQSGLINDNRGPVDFTDVTILPNPPKVRSSQFQR